MAQSAPVPSDDADDCSSSISPTTVSNMGPPTDSARTRGDHLHRLDYLHRCYPQDVLDEMPQTFFFLMPSADDHSRLHVQEPPVVPASLLRLLLGVSFLRTQRLPAHVTVAVPSPPNSRQPGAAHRPCSSSASYLIRRIEKEYGRPQNASSS